MPSPTPPTQPDSHSSHIWCEAVPAAARISPPHHRKADTTPPLRGPERSSQPPNKAAEQPRKMKNRVYMNCRLVIFQSQPVLVRLSMKLWSGEHATALVMPTARDSGSQNTEKP